MALAALISAYHESAEPGGTLRALLPLAGRTLIERQAKLAANAGAQRILVLVERVPPELLAAVDRLRADGLVVGLARNAADAAEDVDPTDAVLLFADGFIGDEDEVRRLASAPAPALLTVPDGIVDERYERIDAESRWGGLALVDGALLADTAAMLRDWDPQSTLLRRAVQADARMLAVGGEAEFARMTIAERASDLASVHRAIVARAATGRSDWVSTYLLAPLERTAAHALMGTQVHARIVGAAAALLTGLGALLFVWHYLWFGLVLLLLATPLDGIADRLARLRMEDGLDRSWWHILLPALAATALMTAGLSLARDHGWGTIVAGGATLLFVLAQRLELGGRRVRGEGLLAERKGMTWLMLPFAVAGFWLAGLGALAAYAVGSFFWAQHKVHSAPPASQRD